MARFYGNVGFGIQTETSPGVWQDVITEHDYYGDILRISVNNQDRSTVNNNIVINNEISIISDDFAFANFANIRYVNWMGVNWIVTNITVQYPRLILTIGGVYNGEVPET
jgi:hypothetical protein